MARKRSTAGCALFDTRPDQERKLHESGVEDISTDAFADQFVQGVKADAKAVEKENAKMAHQPTA